MDPVPLVKKKLSESEDCICCVYGKLVDDWAKSDRYFAIIKRDADYALFLYTSKRVPCFSVSDLSLDGVIPVDHSLQCLPAEGFPTSGGQVCSVRLVSNSRDVNHLLELPDDANTGKFLQLLKKARSESKGLGLPPTFNWLEKYRRQIAGEDQETNNSNANPFATDVFDPLKHMNISSDANNVVVDGSSGKQGEELAFEDNFFTPSETMDTGSRATMDLGSRSTFFVPSADTGSQGSLDRVRTATMGSRDSLDMLDRHYEEPATPIEMLERQLGLGPGTEIPVGAKPISVREQFVRHYMSERENEFTDVTPFRVFCGTWNVNGKSPAESLKPWLQMDAHPPDIYAIGFQELDLAKEMYLNFDSIKEQQWRAEVRKYLHPKAKYKELRTIRLIGIMLVVFIQEKYLKHVVYIDTTYVPTGLLGMVGNKGGVALRMTLHGTSICFINSHLAAHQDEVERRNQDYRDIQNKMRFKGFTPPLTLTEHDMVFWVGDLNYRISNVSIEDVKSVTDSGNYQRLLPYDQLLSQLGTTDVFAGYTEGKITFPPTYKYDPGTNNWDTSEKCRCPAWCDRVLWRGENIQQLRYNYHQELLISDHKPVSSLFEVGVKVIDQSKMKKVYEDTMKKLDRLENEYLPQVKLDKTEFFFDEVKFIEPKVQVLTIANTGQVPVHFEFINKLNEASFCKPWLRVDPSQSFIEEGRCCEIQLEVYVDKRMAGELTAGEKMEDILVMHLQNGKDCFIPVSGKYIPSSFGSSIQSLVQMHGPIREVPVAQLVEIEQPGSLSRVDLTDGGRLFLIPKEIWRLVDHLYRNGMDTEALFQQPGIPHELRAIRECLDTGKPDRVPGSVHSVAESLLIFLEALPEPIIPISVYQRCLEASNNFLLSSNAVKDILDCHKFTFEYLMVFLKEVLQHREKNGLDHKFLASLFGEVLLRPPKKLQEEEKNNKRIRTEAERKRAAFVYLFLTNDPVQS